VIRQIAGLCGGSEEQQSLNARRIAGNPLSNSHYRGKRSSVAEARRGFPKEIGILGEEDPPQGPRLIKKIGVWSFIEPSLLGGHDIDAVRSQCIDDHASDMNVR
jgi:hypothetical protein